MGWKVKSIKIPLRKYYDMDEVVNTWLLEHTYWEPVNWRISQDGNDVLLQIKRCINE